MCGRIFGKQICCFSQGSAATLFRWGERLFNFMLWNLLRILNTKYCYNRLIFFRVIQNVKRGTLYETVCDAVLRHGLFNDVRLQASLRNVPLCEVPVLTATLLRSRRAVFDLVQCSRSRSLYDTLIIFVWWWWWWWCWNTVLCRDSVSAGGGFVVRVQADNDGFTRSRVDSKLLSHADVRRPRLATSHRKCRHRSVRRRWERPRPGV